MADRRLAVELEAEEPAHRSVVGLLLALAVGGLLIVGLVGEPTESAALPGLSRYALRIAEPLWHTTEPVNEIVYGTRGFDTFGETFLLLAAVIAVSTVARRREARTGFIGEERLGRQEQQKSDPGGGRTGSEEEAHQAEEGEDSGDGGAGRGPEPERPATPDGGRLGPGLEQAEAMTVVVRGSSRVAAPLLLVAGVYLAAWGYSPGGGFPAGAVILGVVLLAYVAYGYKRVQKVVRPDVVETLEIAGALLIVAIEALGLVYKGSFSANWMPLGGQQSIQSGGVLQAFSGSELIEVATGLTLAVFGLLGMGHDWSPDPFEDAGDGGGGERTGGGRE